MTYLSCMVDLYKSKELIDRNINPLAGEHFPYMYFNDSFSCFSRAYLKVLLGVFSCISHYLSSLGVICVGLNNKDLQISLNALLLS